jgi:hypothetical protein
MTPGWLCVIVVVAGYRDPGPGTQGNERLPARIPGAIAVVEARMWGMQDGRASGQAVRLRNHDVGDGWWRSVVALIEPLTT